MRIWDSIKRVFHDVAEKVEAPFTDVGDETETRDAKDSDVEQGLADVPEGYEIRHQPAYDHVTGVESMQPMLVKSSDVNKPN